MSLSELIKADDIVATLEVANKKEVLQALTPMIASAVGESEANVFHKLLQRERLGTTAIGEGVAIPHARLGTRATPSVIFARLAKPVDFGAADGKPVDLVFMLAAPETAGADHLQALAKIARFVRAPRILQRLREARDALELRAIFEAPFSHAAA